MKSRKELNQIRRKKKFLAGVLLLIIPLGSSVGLSFADADVKSKLANWFDNKGQQSISLIESAILSEKELQKQRLKEELELEMGRSAKDLEEFTSSHKEAKIKELREYTDSIIANINVDTEGEKSQVVNEIEKIMAEAKEEILTVSLSAPPKNNPAPNPNNEKKNNPENNGNGNENGGKKEEPTPPSDGEGEGGNNDDKGNNGSDNGNNNGNETPNPGNGEGGNSNKNQN